MEPALLLEYGWVLLILVGLEGLLAADNAVVMAVMVKHLPPEQQKKALFYGLAGAFVFRFAALFMISILVDVWQIQAIGALYLLFIAIHNIRGKYANKNKEKEEKNKKPEKQSSFWMTVLKVEVADIAFAIDSMLAAVALAITLTPTGWFPIGGIDGGQFLVMLMGGIIGLIIMRFAANWFVKLLHSRPSLETAAFLIVGWVGVKLAVFTLAHPNVSIISEHFPESKIWKGVFWTVLILIAIGGYFFSNKEAVKAKEEQAQ